MPLNTWRLTIVSIGLLALAVTEPRPVGAATFTVTDFGDSGVPGQLRMLINQAASGDTILIPAGTIMLTGAAGDDLNASGDLDITKALTIQGAGPGVTVIDGGGIDRVFDIFSTVSISGLTIRNGNPGLGAGPVASGGGIRNSAFLSLSNVVVSGNTTSFVGGGIYNSSVATLTNVTLSGNSAQSQGGGIHDEGTLTLTNVTLSGNSANFGGGISEVPGTVRLKNTLLANNPSQGNCFQVPLNSSLGHNLSSDTSCDFTGPGDLSNTDPLLGPLADNGGPTLTHALLPGSPAIDAGDNAGCPPTDQRGFRRPVDGNGDATATCDIGASELVSIATSLVAAVLPTERAELIGVPVTAFATAINTGPATALGCAIAPLIPFLGTFLYQTTNAMNALTGSPNTPVAIPPGAAQSFLLAFTTLGTFTPTVPLPRTEIPFSVACTNSAPAPIVSGVNTFFLRATTTPVPDPVALVATLNNDGIVRLASTGVFTVATINLGAPGLMTVSADTGGVALPVSVAICETNPVTSDCLAPPTPTVQKQINSGATPTFGIFVTGTAPMPFDPANNRIQVHFEGGGGGGGTSVAVCSVPLCP